MEEINQNQEIKDDVSENQKRGRQKKRDSYPKSKIVVSEPKSKKAESEPKSRKG